jgi:hypothetical protein
MRNKCFLWLASALFIIAGCTKNAINNENPMPEMGKYKLVITASAPSESPQTRINLAPEANTKNIIVTWKAGDILYFFFQQGTTLEEGNSVTLAQQDISSNGKVATFPITVPAGIDTGNPFKIYALHGAPYILDNGKVNVNVSPVGFSLLTALNNVPVSGEVTVTPPVGSITIPFNHLGVLQCLNFKNTSTSDFVITPTLANASGTDWYYTYSGGTTAPHYDLIGKTVEDATVMPSAAGNVTIPSNSTVQLAQWIMPTADNTPEIKLRAPNGGTTYISNNCKPARGSAMQQGSAYHLYAIWDGNELYFTNNAFTPKSSIQPNPLSYVAEYNIKSASDGFVTDLTACDESGYFRYDTAVNLFSDITFEGKHYHLPSIEEWSSVVPQNSNWVSYGSNNPYDNQSETVTIANSSYTMTSDFRNKSATRTTYALRYKGTDLVSAWKYEYRGSGNNTHLKITSRSVYEQTVSITDIEDDTFWSSNTENNIVRYFPASGWKYTDFLKFRGSNGFFWSSSPQGSYSWGTEYSSSSANSNYSSTYERRLSVRLFATNN